MGTKKLSPNASCPCGSGKKYKRCCYEKGFHYLVQDDGTIVRAVPMDAMPATELQELRRFVANAPPDEPLFKPDTWDRVIAGMRQAGFPAAYVFAVEKTGLMLSPENRHLMADKDIAEFEEAMAQYEREHGGDPEKH